MSRPTKLKLEERLQKESLLRSWFWQGSRCGKVYTSDIKLQSAIEKQAIERMKQSSILHAEVI